MPLPDGHWEVNCEVGLYARKLSDGLWYQVGSIQFYNWYASGGAKTLSASQTVTIPFEIGQHASEYEFGALDELGNITTLTINNVQYNTAGSSGGFTAITGVTARFLIDA